MADLAAMRKVEAPYGTATRHRQSMYMHVRPACPPCMSVMQGDPDPESIVKWRPWASAERVVACVFAACSKGSRCGTCNDFCVAPMVLFESTMHVLAIAVGDHRTAISWRDLATWSPK
eukprot:2926014-Prymnesium_polylepis.2